MTGADAHLAERVGRMGEEAEQRDQSGRHQQRLGDGGVPDGVGVSLGAEVQQIEVCHRGEPLEALLESGQLEPGGEEAGSLGALTGRDDDEHGATLPHRASGTGTGANQARGVALWDSYKIGGGCSSSRPRVRATRKVKASRGSVGTSPLTSVILRSR